MLVNVGGNWTGLLSFVSKLRRTSGSVVPLGVVLIPAEKSKMPLPIEALCPAASIPNLQPLGSTTGLPCASNSFGRFVCNISCPPGFIVAVPLLSLNVMGLPVAIPMIAPYAGLIWLVIPASPWPKVSRDLFNSSPNELGSARCGLYESIDGLRGL